MLTCANRALQARKAPTVCAENPHCGKSGVPFMYSTTGAAASWALIRSIASIVDSLHIIHRRLATGGLCHGRAPGGPQLYDNRPHSTRWRPIAVAGRATLGTPRVLSLNYWG